MLVVAPPLALRLVLGRLLQVDFQTVQTTDGIEPIPGLTEPEADLLVVGDRTFEVVDEELWSEGGQTHRRLHGVVGHWFGINSVR